MLLQKPHMIELIIFNHNIYSQYQVAKFLERLVAENFTVHYLVFSQSRDTQCRKIVTEVKRLTLEQNK
ncbi:hypothetical protein X777_13301 [Ooceraea biroi]|uniref:Uncharacterized protein n=1 Tax=Ooceraea biroi TaxID=2015173 RepID=A0A026WWL2_OOCBI|nr:hypothetical protein X777_13301 [Ooceraea biroi]